MTSSTLKKPGLIGWVLIILLSIIWGASFFSVSYALEGFSPLTLAAARIVIAATCLTTFAFISGNGLPTLRTKIGLRIWLHCLGMGLLSNAIPFSLLSWGQQYVSSGFAGISMAIVPLFVLPLAITFIEEETFSIKKAIGFFVGFIGVVLLVGPITSLEHNGTTFSTARLACVLAAACYSVGSIITRLCPKVSLISFSAAALILASLIILPIALMVEGMPKAPPITSLLAIGYLGLMPTAIATIILVKIIQTAGPSFYSLVNYQVPIWAIIFGVIFLQEKLSSQFFFAFFLIIGGLFITQVKVLNTKR